MILTNGLKESFLKEKNNNKDNMTIRGFGDEWSTYRQNDDVKYDLQKIYSDYFAWFDDHKIDYDNVLDVGCGSGRWARFVARKASQLDVLDPSAKALKIARSNLADFKNITYINSTADDLDCNRNYSFVYSLGVLHHIPDTRAAVKTVSEFVKPGGHLLLYLYYRFDNRPKWFQIIWWLSNILRKVISKLPFPVRKMVCLTIAFIVYWPVSRLYKVIRLSGRNPKNFPLSYYSNKKLSVLKTDALDRFGTRLENRFTQREIREFLTENNFTDIQFKDGEPFWTVIARKTSS